MLTPSDKDYRLTMLNVSKNRRLRLLEIKKYIGENETLNRQTITSGIKVD